MILLGKQLDPEMLPPLALAYLGDAVYELLVRTMLINAGLTRVDVLHKSAVKLVRAGTQAGLVRQVEGWLTVKELRILKRGRNAKGSHVPRSAAPIEYRHSTGLESLVGYWYLTGNQDQLQRLYAELEQLYQA